jgi:acylphosphatase
MIQRRVMIKGRVQGVAFRASALEQAKRYPTLCGYVRNLPDGSVEALFMGKDEEVLSMVAWCKRGPPSAKVASLEIKEEDSNPNLKNFYISR